jgi:hypothetical protein
MTVNESMQHNGGRTGREDRKTSRERKRRCRERARGDAERGNMQREQEKQREQEAKQREEIRREAMEEATAQLADKISSVSQTHPPPATNNNLPKKHRLPDP